MDDAGLSGNSLALYSQNSPRCFPNRSSGAAYVCLLLRSAWQIQRRSSSLDHLIWFAGAQVARHMGDAARAIT